MRELIATYGYPALFLLSFLAATLIPLGSEWLLIAMIVQRHDPVAIVVCATIGNFLGACTSYAIGFYGGNFLINRVLRITVPQQQRAELFFAKYGSWSLLLSWLPVIGDPLCLVGGLLKIGFIRFSAFVATGKLVRYAAVAWITLAGTENLTS